jgi:hypothetical protein
MRLLAPFLPSLYSLPHDKVNDTLKLIISAAMRVAEYHQLKREVNGLGKGMENRRLQIS